MLDTEKWKLIVDLLWATLNHSGLFVSLADASGHYNLTSVWLQLFQLHRTRSTPGKASVVIQDTWQKLLRKRISQNKDSNGDQLLNFEFMGINFKLPMIIFREKGVLLPDLGRRVLTHPYNDSSGVPSTMLLTSFSCRSQEVSLTSNPCYMVIKFPRKYQQQQQQWYFFFLLLQLMWSELIFALFRNKLLYYESIHYVNTEADSDCLTFLIFICLWF